MDNIYWVSDERSVMGWIVQWTVCDGLKYSGTCWEVPVVSAGKVIKLIPINQFFMRRRQNIFVRCALEKPTSKRAV